MYDRKYNSINNIIEIIIHKNANIKVLKKINIYLNKNINYTYIDITYRSRKFFFWDNKFACDKLILSIFQGFDINNCLTFVLKKHSLQQPRTL